MLEVDWSDSPDRGTFDNQTGTSTTFTTNPTGGSTTITGDNTDLIIDDTFELNIITAEVDYIQIRNAPSNGGQVITDLTLDVGQSAELWAAAYNYSALYIGDRISTIWTVSMGANLISVLSPGANTTVLANMMGGNAEITADLNGVENFTSVYVNPPTINSIRINDAQEAAGNEVVDPTFCVGFESVFWGAYYNTTAGFLYQTSSSSTWTSGDQNLVSVTSPGNSSSIAVNRTIGGETTLTLVDGTRQVIITITVLWPNVDTIYIRDLPNGQGNMISYPLYDVGDEKIYFAASYNETAGYLGDLSASWSSTDEDVGNITALNGYARFKAKDIGYCIVSAEYSGKTGDTQTITVLDMTSPTANAGSGGTINESESFEFDAGSSYDNGEIVDYNWSFGDGSYLGGMESSPSHLYRYPGIYTVKLTVTDSAGNQDVDEITIIVRDITSPKAKFTLQEFAEQNAPCNFNGSASYDNVGIIQYVWEFGDGKRYIGIYSTVTHIYAKTGNYTVSLTVKDAAGQKDKVTSFILVKDLTPPSRPKGLEIDLVKDGEALKINWDPVSDSDLDHYELYCSEGGGGFSKIADFDPGVTTYTHRNLENGKSYGYYLIAVDGNNNLSPNSIEVEGTPDVDTDSDGIYNLQDYDDDNDGLPDSEELEVGSEPLNPDTDGDLRLDGEDAFPLDRNEWKDTDFDGIGDNSDDLIKDDSEIKDSDGDGIGDNSDFIPIHDLLFMIIVAVIVIVALIGTMTMIKRRKIKRDQAAWDALQSESQQPASTTEPSEQQDKTVPPQTAPKGPTQPQQTEKSPQAPKQKGA
ncbi:MAG: PKD domain-containing protein [Methanomassiliicoccales archaeon]|nr:MAG: PKD domain-containing protein [Methanomassiliicoccales archaeon]